VINLFVRRLRIILQQRGDRHDHARCAKTALQRVAIGESLLHGVQFLALREAFDRDDVGPARLHRQHRARLDGAAVDVDRAAAALARIAPDVRAGQLQLVAQHIDEQRAVFHVARLFGAVNGEFDFRHVLLAFRLKPFVVSNREWP